MTNEEIEVKSLIALLESRRDEYGIFGKTSDDAMRDAQIRAKIEALQNSSPLTSIEGGEGNK